MPIPSRYNPGDVYMLSVSRLEGSLLLLYWLRAPASTPHKHTVARDEDNGACWTRRCGCARSITTTSNKSRATIYHIKTTVQLFVHGVPPELAAAFRSLYGTNNIAIARAAIPIHPIKLLRACPLRFGHALSSTDALFLQVLDISGLEEDDPQ